MSASIKQAWLDSGKAIALAVALGISLIVIYPLAFLALPAAPIPVAYITYRYGILAGLATGVVSGAITLGLLASLSGLLSDTGNALILSLLVSLCIFMLVALVGAAAGLGLRKGLGQRNVFILIALGFFICLGLSAAVFVISAVVSANGSLQEVLKPGEDIARNFNTFAGMSEDQINEEIRLIRYVTPAVLLIISIALSGLTMAMARRAFTWLKQPFPRDFVFRELRLHFVFAYVMIAGLLCELAAPVIPETYQDPVSVVGLNLIVAAEALFFIQGMAIAAWFLRQRKVSKPFRVLIYAGLVLLQALLSLVSWLGLFDTWLDYRKRFGRKKAQGG